EEPKEPRELWWRRPRRLQRPTSNSALLGGTRQRPRNSVPGRWHPAGPGTDTAAPLSRGGGAPPPDGHG
ncbi:hypothetical protein P7K49_027627, partial [Saguinus oedipus]